MSEDLRLQILDLRNRDEENRRKISDQSAAIEKISSGLSCPDSRQEPPQGSREALVRFQESPHEEHLDGFLDFTNSLQSGSSHCSTAQMQGHPGNREEEARGRGGVLLNVRSLDVSYTAAPKRSASVLRALVRKSQTSVPTSPNNTPSFQRTTSADRASQRPSQQSTPVQNPENNQSTSQSTSRINSNGQSATGSGTATPVSRKRKWRKSNEAPKKPKRPSLRQERRSMTPQVKEADEQTVSPK